MTGFGSGSAPLGTGRLAVEARAVNGRFLDVRVRLPEELAELSIMVESEVRQRLSRGRCDIVIRSEGNVFSAMALDKERARRAYVALLELRDEIAPGTDVPFSMIASVPELFQTSERADVPSSRSAVQTAVTAALADLEQMRRREGEAIESDLRARLARVRAHADAVLVRAPELALATAAKFRERLERIASLLASEGGPRLGDPSLDAMRVEQELVLLVERSDIAEELTRLESHVDQMLAYMQEDEPLGRRLDFLLQEMAREINTIGAKSQDLRTSHAVVELKAEIERMREQVQNVE